jgi:hypothetical protein
MNVSAAAPLVKVAELKMRQKRFAPAAVADERFIFIMGGADAGGGLLTTIERFDTETNTSEDFATLQQGRIWHQAVLHAGKIYVLGGSRLGPTAEASATVTDTLRASAAERAAFNLYGADPGPSAGTTPEDSMERVDLATRKVSPLPAMPEPRSQFGSAVLNGELYVIGGQRIHAGRRSWTNTVLIYSFVTGKWHDGVPMPTPRGTDLAVVDGPFLVAAGGYNGSTSLRNVEAFNPRNNSWILLPALAQPSSAHSTAFLGHYLYLFGNFSAPEELTAYDLNTKTSQTYTLSYTPARNTACVVVGKKIYVIGGKSSKQSEPLDRIQVFEPTTRKSE